MEHHYRKCGKLGKAVKNWGELRHIREIKENLQNYQKT
jgi:hypothetical protein